MTGIELSVLAKTLDERVDKVAELLTELLGLGIRVDLLADVEPEDERLGEHLVVFVCAAQQQQVHDAQLAQLCVVLVEQVVRECVA